MMAGPKLPPGAQVIQLEPKESYAPKLPPGATVSDVPENYPPDSSFKPNAAQEFVGTLAEDAGSIIPGLASTAKGLVTHPVDTVNAISKGAIGDSDPRLWGVFTPGVHAAKTVWNEATQGHPGKAAAHVVEAAGPTIFKGIGRALGRPASSLAESAAGIRRVDRAHGKTPGRAILEETRGITPEAVGESAEKRALQLNSQLESLAQSAPDMDLASARRTVADAIDRARSRNAGKTAAQLEEMDSFLRQPIPGFGGSLTPAGEISTVQPASVGLQLKRGFGDEFVHNWNPEVLHDVKGVASRTYGALDQALDKAIPQGAELNQRMSSLIPVSRRAGMTALNEPLSSRIAHRIAAHTGSLAGALAGYHYGGAPGAMAGLVLPEVLVSPTSRMLAARALYGAGKVMQNPAVTVPGTGIGLAVRGGIPNGGQ